jgi:transcription termination factor Rho
VDTTELRRSALERKDRDELTTIAKSLGAKPPSRARKAEIVDLILTTVATEAAGNGDDGSDDESSERPEPMTYHAGEDEEFDFGEVTDARDGKAGGRPRSRTPQKNDGGRDREKNEKGETTQQRSRGDDQPERGNRRARRRRGGQSRERDNEQSWDGEPVPVDGFLDLRDDGYGFLRVNGFRASKEDAYVSVKQVRQFGLRRGDHLLGTSRPANRNEKNPALLTIESINQDDPEKAKDRPQFENLTPLFPENMTARIIDLLAPIGKGQRGLIVSPPKAGKTTIMKTIARSIETNNPEVELIVLLVDERPEEVTDMQRWLQRGEVAASTFDRPAEEHTMVAEITIERAKRMVEMGRDVVIMLDGITRLARAYNLAAPATGRIMSGGVDSGALYPPKKFFGAARNVEEGGSLTILATALVETGSKMDEVIFEEFKGTGNMELRLDRRSAERRIYPAIDVDASSTRHEELLFAGRNQLQQVWKLRRVLSGMASDSDKGGAAGLELLMDRLKTFPTNEEFLKEVAKGPMA